MRYIQKQDSCHEFDPHRRNTRNSHGNPPPTKDEPKYSILLEPNHGDELYPPILSIDMMNAIASNGLPMRLKHGRWTRLYNSHRDGNSFAAFLGRARGHRPTVLVVRTARGGVIGGYAEHDWAVRPGFFGTGNTFLFAVETQTFGGTSGEGAGGGGRAGGAEGRDSGDDLSAISFVSSQLLCMCFQDGYDICRLKDLGVDGPYSSGEQVVKIFRWTKKNDYFQLCTGSDERIALGGGGLEGNFGLCLEGDLSYGSTGLCDTFDNDPLTEEGVFDIEAVEVYGVESSVVSRAA